MRGGGAQLAETEGGAKGRKRKQGGDGIRDGDGGGDVDVSRTKTQVRGDKVRVLGILGF